MLIPACCVAYSLMVVDVSGQLQVAGGGEARAAVDLVHVGVALVDVAGLLAGGEVAAHEAEHGLVDGHAHRHGPLVADVAHGADADGGDLEVLDALSQATPHPHRQEDPHHLLAHDPYERRPALLPQRAVQVQVEVRDHGQVVRRRRVGHTGPKRTPERFERLGRLERRRGVHGARREQVQRLLRPDQPHPVRPAQRPQERPLLKA